MRQWTVTIEDNKGEGIVDTFQVRAESIIHAAITAQEYVDQNYLNMEVVSIMMNFGC
jgi:hypothetical protein